MRQNGHARAPTKNRLAPTRAGRTCDTKPYRFDTTSTTGPDPVSVFFARACTAQVNVPNCSMGCPRSRALPPALHSGCAEGRYGAGGPARFKGRRAQPRNAADAAEKHVLRIVKSLGRRPRRSLERPAVGDEAEARPRLALARAAVTPAKSPAGAEGSGLQYEAPPIVQCRIRSGADATGPHALGTDLAEARKILSTSGARLVRLRMGRPRIFQILELRSRVRARSRLPVGPPLHAPGGSVWSAVAVPPRARLARAGGGAGPLARLCGRGRAPGRRRRCRALGQPRSRGGGAARLRDLSWFLGPFAPPLAA